MEVVVTTAAIRRTKLQSMHHQQTNIKLFTGQMPFLSPNQSTEGNAQQSQSDVHKCLHIRILTKALEQISFQITQLMF